MAYFFLRLDVLRGVFVAGSEVAGSVSRGAGGGVVSIVQPIHADITSTQQDEQEDGYPNRPPLP